MRTLATLAAVGVALACAAPAAGSVARVRHDPCVPGPHGVDCVLGPANVLEYLSGPGEQNQLTVTPSGGGLVVTDPGANVQAQSGCTQVDAHSARCPASRAEIHTGDCDDSVDLTRVGATL